MSESTNPILTCSKNSAQCPRLLIPKQIHQSSDKVAAECKAKEDAKQEREEKKAASIKHIAKFEQNQAAKDAIEWTPQVVTKTNQLVHTRSYANVLHNSDVEMTDMTTPSQSDNPFNLKLAVEEGRTTDDGDRTEICVCTDIAISAYYFCILKILCTLY